MNSVAVSTKKSWFPDSITGILATYLISLLPFIILAYIRGVGLINIVLLSMMLLGIGLIHCSIHPLFGLIFILSVGLFNILDTGLPNMMLGEGVMLWTAAILPFLLFSFYAQLVKNKNNKFITQALLMILVAGSIVAGRQIILQIHTSLPYGFLWTAILLGTFVLVGDDMDDMDTPATIGVLSGIISGIIAGWQWYDILFSPTSFATWIDYILHFFFTVVVTIGIIVVYYVIVINGSDKNDPSFLPRRYLFFGAFLVLATIYQDLETSLLTAALSVVFFSISFPLIDRWTHSSNAKKIPAAAFSGFLSLMLGSLILFESAHAVEYLIFLLFRIPIETIGYALGTLIVASIILTFSGFHWITLVSGILMWISIVVGHGAFNFSTSAYIAGIIALAALIGASRILLWPVASLLLRFRLGKIKVSAGEKQSSDRLWLAKLLDKRMFPAPLGYETVLKDFVASNFHYDFNNQRIKKKFDAIQETAALQVVVTQNSFEEALELARHTSLKDSLDGFTTALGNTRRFEQMRQFAKTIHTLESVSGSNEARARLISLAYSYVEPVKQTYWNSYNQLDESSLKKAKSLETRSLDLQKFDQKELAKRFDTEVRAIGKMTNLVGKFKPNLDECSPSEQAYYQLFMEIGRRQIRGLSDLSDLQEHARIIQDGMTRLTNTSKEMVDDWEAVALDKNAVIKHPNPWISCIKSLYVHLENLSILNEAYFGWANKQILNALADVQSVEDLANLNDRISMVAGFAQKYGSVVDMVLISLRQIGQEASAALAFPKGFSRRMGLQDTLDSINKLRSILSTRHQQETQELQQHLDRIAETCLSTLFSVEEHHESGYRNPYLTGNPIKLNRSALFKGRQKLAQSIVTMLRSHGNPTFVLYGARRMGKTSFLLQLPRLLPGNFLPVFLDMQEGGAQQNDASFMYAIARAIYRQLRTEGDLKRPELSDFEAHPYTTLTPWIEDEVLPLLKNRFLFITIDEFELIGKAIERESLTLQVLEYLRHMMQHNENIILLFAGVQTIEALGPNPSSYFITANPIEMSYLNKEDAEELITNPDPSAGQMPDYSKSVIAEMINTTHCQPYLIQAICSEIIAIANSENLKRIEMKTLDIAISKVLSSSLYFQNIWDDSREDGQALLKELVNGPQQLDDRDVIKSLLRRGVITKDTDGRFSIEIPLVASWIKMQM